MEKHLYTVYTCDDSSINFKTFSMKECVRPKFAEPLNFGTFFWTFFATALHALDGETPSPTILPSR